MLPRVQRLLIKESRGTWIFLILLVVSYYKQEKNSLHLFLEHNFQAILHKRHCYSAVRILRNTFFFSFFRSFWPRTVSCVVLWWPRYSTELRASFHYARFKGHDPRAAELRSSIKFLTDCARYRKLLAWCFVLYSVVSCVSRMMLPSRMNQWT